MTAQNDEQGATNNGPASVSSVGESFGEIRSAADLKAFLRNVLDKMSDDQAAPVYVLAVTNHLLNCAEIYTWLDNENKELLRDIWLRLKTAGFQVRNPPLLFEEERSAAG